VRRFIEEDSTERFNKFVEVNVKEQVYDLSKTSIVQGAWRNGQDLTVHGWVWIKFRIMLRTYK
jgi:carbonic anhydrase